MSNDDYAYDQTPLVFPDPNDPNAGQPEMDPYFTQLLQSLQYPTSSKGVPNPYNLQTQNLFQNSMQDRQQSLFDMRNTALTGGFAPGAFNPIKTEKQLDFPITGSLMIQSRGTGLENLIAKYVLTGLSPSQAMVKIRQAVTAPGADQDPVMQSLKAALPRLPPGQYDPPGTDTQPDWDAVTKMAASVYDNYNTEQGVMARAALPNSGVIERDGKFFQVTETPSKTTQFFQDQGLDTPNTQYDESYVRNNNPDFAGIEQALQGNFGDLISQRARYQGNEAERLRQADLQRKFTAQDQAAMNRFAGGVQGGMQDYFGGINRDMLTTPAWGGGRYVGDPTVMPQLGQRTATQDAREQALNLAIRPFEAYGGENPSTAVQPTIKQALADYMSQSLREPMTTVPGHPGATMVGGGARGVEMNLPGLPQLSAYGNPNTDAEKLAAITAMLPASLRNMTGIGLTAAQRRQLENQGKLRATGPSTTKQQDANARTDAYKRTHAAQLAYAQAMLPAYLARKAGRTPYQDEIAARAQSMFAAGGMG